MNLGRDSAGSDADQGGDFDSVAPTAAGPNWKPGSGLHHHSFYPAGDQDWLYVQAQAGQRYDLEVFNRCSGAAASMTLLAPDGITALFSEGCDGSFGCGPRRAWIAPADGRYLLNLVNDCRQGDYGSYDLQATVIPVTVPSAAALSPALLGLDVTRPLTLSGDGFVPGLAARFSSPEITCRRVDVVDRSTAVLLVRTSPQAAPGSHDLLLRGPDGAETVLPAALQVDPARSAVVINELNVLENWVELRNSGIVTVDLTGWELRLGAGSSMVTVVLPPAFIGPGAFLTIYDLGTPGENSPAELHLDQFFGWGAGSYGSIALADAALAGRDFVRWDGATGSSLNRPPAGTGWYGPNPVVDSESYGLGRDQGSSDTDRGCDFSAQQGSPGQVNSAPAPLDAQLELLQENWIGEELSLQLAVTGGEPPYRWFLSGGFLPPGLSLSQTGLLQGTPASLGSWPLDLSATDAAGRWDSGELLLEILPGLSASIQAQPAAAAFPCTVALDVALTNLRAGDATVQAELTAAGAPPHGSAAHDVASGTLVLRPGQTTHFDLACDIPDIPQFRSGVIFQLVLRDAAGGVELAAAQFEVQNQHQIQHPQ